jgi:hypothetical protein
MFAPLTRFFARRPDPDEADHVFVRGVTVEHPRESRSLRSERVLAVCWVLIVVKCIALHWLIGAYAVPIHPWWLIGPTLVFATLCTWIYWRRD